MKRILAVVLAVAMVATMGITNIFANQATADGYSVCMDYFQSRDDEGSQANHGNEVEGLSSSTALKGGTIELSKNATYIFMGGWINNDAPFANNGTGSIGYSVDGGDITWGGIFDGAIVSTEYGGNANADLTGRHYAARYYLNVPTSSAGGTIALYAKMESGETVKVVEYDYKFNLTTSVKLPAGTDGGGTTHWFGNGSGSTQTIAVFQSNAAISSIQIPVWAKASIDNTIEIKIYKYDTNLNTTLNTTPVRTISQSVQGDDRGVGLVYDLGELAAGTYAVVFTLTSDYDATYVVFSQCNNTNVQYAGPDIYFNVVVTTEVSEAFAALDGNYADLEQAAVEPEKTEYVDYDTYGNGVNVSFDTLTANGTQCANGNVLEWIEENLDERHVDTTTCASIGIRGWAAFDQQITAFGYMIDGVATFDDAFIQERADVVAAGFENGVGFDITVPTDNISGVLVAVAKLADGTVVALNGAKDTTFALGNATLPTTPATADSSMVVFMLAAAAFVVTVILSKKKEF